MAVTVDCLRCRTPMKPGYILDRKYGGYTDEQWSPGQAQVHWWGAEKPKGSISVISMRRPRCGMLESYAPRA